MRLTRIVCLATAAFVIAGGTMLRGQQEPSAPNAPATAPVPQAGPGGPVGPAVDAVKVDAVGMDEASRRLPTAWATWPPAACWSLRTTKRLQSCLLTLNLVASSSFQKQTAFGLSQGCSLRTPRSR